MGLGVRVKASERYSKHKADQMYQRVLMALPGRRPHGKDCRWPLGADSGHWLTWRGNGGSILTTEKNWVLSTFGMSFRVDSSPELPERNRAPATPWIYPYGPWAENSFTIYCARTPELQNCELISGCRLGMLSLGLIVTQHSTIPALKYTLPSISFHGFHSHDAFQVCDG